MVFALCVGVFYTMSLPDNITNPVLIACSDLHLSELPPTLRTEEPDWFEAQRRTLRWLATVQKECGVLTGEACPIFMAGDLFDKAIGNSRLLSFAASCVPPMYAIPGNHDLPYHNLSKLEESSYGLLQKHCNSIRACTMINIPRHNLTVYGFPFGTPSSACPKLNCEKVSVAMIHHYIWKSCENTFVGVTNEDHVTNVLKRYPGYDFYIFGDNHIGFVADNVLNCGTMYLRTRTDAAHTLFIGVLCLDGDCFHWEKIPIPTDMDILTIKSEVKTNSAFDFSELISVLKNSDAAECDVGSLLKVYLQTHDISLDVRNAVDEITTKG